MTTEAETEFKAFDGMDIYCVVDYAVTQEKMSDYAIIMVHGLTGYPHTYAFHVAARLFSKQGYDVYRPALYSSGETHRNLSQCTTSMHTQDVQAVINDLRPRYKRLYVAGHSLAGTSLIGLTHTADAYSFWDCDYYPWDDTWQYAKPLEGTEDYFVGWGSRNIIGKAMVDEARATSEEMILERLAAVTIPSQVIIAEFGQAGSGQKIYNALKCKKELQELKGSGHVFKEGDSAERLAKLTFDWFERF